MTDVWIVWWISYRFLVFFFQIGQSPDNVSQISSGTASLRQLSPCVRLATTVGSSSCDRPRWSPQLPLRELSEGKHHLWRKLYKTRHVSPWSNIFKVSLTVGQTAGLHGPVEPPASHQDPPRGREKPRVHRMRKDVRHQFRSQAAHSYPQQRETVSVRGVL